jgi:hypothetical protein
VFWSARGGVSLQALKIDSDLDPIRFSFTDKMSFAKELASSQKRRNETNFNEEEERLKIRDEALADLDPHASEIGFPGHIATLLLGLILIGVGLGFFVPLVAASDKTGTSAVDDPVILVPLIAAIVGLFMLFAASVWLKNDYSNNRCNCTRFTGAFKIQPSNAKDLEAQNAVLSPQEALIAKTRDTRAQERQDLEAKKKTLPTTILFANDRILLLNDLFSYYCRELGTNEIGCNGLTELMKDTMMGSDGEASLQESRAFMGLIDLDGDKLVQRNEYLEFMCTRWINESPLSKQFASMDDFLVKLHRTRIIQNSGNNGVPKRPEVLGNGGIPCRLVEEQELGVLDTKEKILLNREIIKDLFKWYDKDSVNAIDCNGLLALMSDLVADGEVSLSETDRFMNEIDQDGDRLLQCDELISYMMDRWCDSAPRAVRFDKDVGSFLSVVYPIVQKKLLYRWRVERGIPEPPPSQAVKPAPQKADPSPPPVAVVSTEETKEVESASARASATEPVPTETQTAPAEEPATTEETETPVAEDAVRPAEES